MKECQVNRDSLLHQDISQRLNENKKNSSNGNIYEVSTDYPFKKNVQCTANSEFNRYFDKWLSERKSKDVVLNSESSNKVSLSKCSIENRVEGGDGNLASGYDANTSEANCSKEKTNIPPYNADALSLQLNEYSEKELERMLEKHFYEEGECEKILKAILCHSEDNDKIQPSETECQSNSGLGSQNINECSCDTELLQSESRKQLKKNGDQVLRLSQECYEALLGEELIITSRSKGLNDIAADSVEEKVREQIKYNNVFKATMLNDNPVGEGETECYVRHEKCIASGTYGRIDSIFINDKAYTCKVISDNAVEKLYIEAMAKGKILKAFKAENQLSENDVNAFSLYHRSFVYMMDFGREVEHMQRARNILSEIDNMTTEDCCTLVGSDRENIKVVISVHVPQVDERYSGKHCIIMKSVEGVALSEREQLSATFREWTPSWNNNKSLEDDDVYEILRKCAYISEKCALRMLNERWFMRATLRPEDIVISLTDSGVQINLFNWGGSIIYDPVQSLYLDMAYLITRKMSSKVKELYDVYDCGVGEDDFNLMLDELKFKIEIGDFKLLSYYSFYEKEEEHYSINTSCKHVSNTFLCRPKIIKDWCAEVVDFYIMAGDDSGVACQEQTKKMIAGSLKEVVCKAVREEAGLKTTGKISDEVDYLLDNIFYKNNIHLSVSCLVYYNFVFNEVLKLSEDIEELKSLEDVESSDELCLEEKSVERKTYPSTKNSINGCILG